MHPCGRAATPTADKNAQGHFGGWLAAGRLNAGLLPGCLLAGCKNRQKQISERGLPVWEILVGLLRVFSIYLAAPYQNWHQRIVNSNRGESKGQFHVGEPSLGVTIALYT